MTKIQLPELDEYIKDYNWKKEFYPRTRYDREYDKIELELLTEILVEAYGRQPTEEEIEEQKIELMKIKYLVKSWENEFFEQVEKEHKKNLEKNK